MKKLIVCLLLAGTGFAAVQIPTIDSTVSNNRGTPVTWGPTNASGQVAVTVDAMPVNLLTSLSPAMTGTPTINGQSIETQLTNKVSKAGDTMTGTLIAPEVDAAELYTGSFKLYRGTLTPIDAGTQLDFGSTNRYWSCTLTGAVTFTTANLAAGKHANIMITGVATNAAYTWPANWIFIGYKPTYLTANKHADIYLKSTGTTDAGVWAYYGEEQ